MMDKINKKKILKVFVFFLKEENIYKSYLHNIYNRFLDKNKCTNFIINELNDYLGINLISGLFTWRNTEEGYKFWFTINKKWENKLNTIVKFENDII